MPTFPHGLIGFGILLWLPQSPAHDFLTSWKKFPAINHVTRASVSFSNQPDPKDSTKQNLCIDPAIILNMRLADEFQNTQSPNKAILVKYQENEFGMCL